MNLLFQIAVGDYLPMAHLGFDRHCRLAHQFGAVHALFNTPLLFSTKFWQKWRRVSQMFQDGYELIVAADADCLWQKPENIFAALPDDQDFGLTWQSIRGCPETPSAGCVWVRNTPRNVALVDRIIELETEHHDLAAHDQGAMMRALREQGRDAYRIANRWHSPLEDAVIRSWHCDVDRLEKMRACLETIEASERATSHSLV